MRSNDKLKEFARIRTLFALVNMAISVAAMAIIVYLVFS
jgi:hypothetical protein